ncbi:MAG: hypothetical protein ABIK12_07215 [Pseudomonadota bacterium]
MTQGTCNLTADHVAGLRRAILDFKRADDRNYNDKERPLQLAEDLANALLAQLFDVEAEVGMSPVGQCRAPGPDTKGTTLEGRFSSAVQAFTDAKLLELESEKRLAQGDAEALMHLRPKG